MRPMNEEFRRRRRELTRLIDPGVLVLPAAALALRNNDVEHDFRQDSDIYYLTGFEEPECLLVLSSREGGRSVVFLRPRDLEREAWDGQRLGAERAVEALGVDEAYPYGDLRERLPALIGGHDRLYYRLGFQRGIDDVVLHAIATLRARARHGSHWPTEIVDPAVVLHEMRLIKSEAELDLMRKAAQLTCDAHVHAMRIARPGIFEYELEAELVATFRRGGSRRDAYAPIVGSGPNATTLHYRDNTRQTCPGDLVLVDAGCEYGYYAADVTRTFPISGRFSGPQRAVYEVVLDAQRAAIEAVRPGTTLDAIHEACRGILIRGMLDLKLVDGPEERVLEDKSYTKFFMHRTSHWLGMDVHDVGLYQRAGQPRPLQAGMVLTIEPGLYIAADSDAPEAFRGIGVRIEDDVVVVDGGGEVITARAPKDPDTLEAVCS